MPIFRYGFKNKTINNRQKNQIKKNIDKALKKLRNFAKIVDFLVGPWQGIRIVRGESGMGQKQYGWPEKKTIIVLSKLQ